MIEDKTGHRVPHVTFRIRESSRWVTRTTEDYFLNKRVVLFALPGAFTPVCSTLHLPAYNDLYDTFRASGIDDVLCLAVNDSFVLEAWKKAEKAYKITMIPDVEGEFSQKLGFLVSKSDMCLGNRSWRYSMIVDDGIIEKMFIEPYGVGSDPYGESSAETVLKYLNPSARIPDSITIFTKYGCEECEEAKSLLESHHLSYEELVLNEKFTIKTVKALSGTTFLPQIFISGMKIQNLSDLRAYLATQNEQANQISLS